MQNTSDVYSPRQWTNFGSVNLKQEPGDLYQEGAFQGEQFDSGYPSFVDMQTPHCKTLEGEHGCGPLKKPYGPLPEDWV